MLRYPYRLNIGPDRNFIPIAAAAVSIIKRPVARQAQLIEQGAAGGGVRPHPNVYEASDYCNAKRAYPE